MRIAVLVTAVLSMCLGASGADSNPYLKLTSVMKDGKFLISVKNVSHQPIVAYVIRYEDGGHSATHHGVYTGKDVFAAGKTVKVVFAAQSASSTPKIFVDYVRLADSSSWGDPVTQDGKEVAARFQK